MRVCMYTWFNYTTNCFARRLIFALPILVLSTVLLMKNVY